MGGLIILSLVGALAATAVLLKKQMKVTEMWKYLHEKEAHLNKLLKEEVERTYELMKQLEGRTEKPDEFIDSLETPRYQSVKNPKTYVEIVSKVKYMGDIHIVYKNRKNLSIMKTDNFYSNFKVA